MEMLLVLALASQQLVVAGLPIITLKITHLPLSPFLLYPLSPSLPPLQALKSSVRRRYKDFEMFHELLLSRYLYRLVPRLPPKKLPVAQSGAFIEQRRRSLKRFLVLVVRHPVLSRDEITRYFLTATSGQVSRRGSSL